MSDRWIAKEQAETIAQIAFAEGRDEASQLAIDGGLQYAEEEDEWAAANDR
jgi:hypothetical protein